MSTKRKSNFHRSNTNRKPSKKFTNQKRTNPKIYHHQNQLTEIDVGITQFISKLDGFSGIIKARFSDFHVNEVNCDGEIAKLTDNSIPKEFRNEKKPCKDCDDIIDSPLECLPQEIWMKMKELSKSPDTKETVDLDVENLAKDQRKSIHDLIKQYFLKKICANTLTINDKKVMQFKRYDAKDANNRSQPWPENLGEYVHFLVYKENLDTLDATMKIADCLKIASSHFNYAGVKDRRAKTTQWFSVRKVEPWKLIIKTKGLKNLKIGNICFKDTPLKLGQLYGNRFRIALRNITVDNSVIESALNGLKQNGFINYYGLQRFGNDKEVPTYSIGVQLLLGNWKEACEIILKPIDGDDPDLDIGKAKRVYRDTNDAQKALKEFDDNRNRCVEFMLLTGLSKHDSNDYVNALENIPRNMRLLYIHSFQSLVWNRVASKRIEQYGLEPVVGDLVFDDDNGLIVDAVDESLDEEKSTKPKVKALTADDLTNHTIYDIVLPLPGYDIVYPEHMKDYYREILESYGLSLEMPKQRVQTYTLSGRYRKFVERVEDLSWRIMHYDDPNSTLIQSDLEALKKVPEPQSVENGKYKALILEFSLKSSSYATMILREILKTDTSSSSHAKLNNYHESNGDKQANIQSIMVKKGGYDEEVEDDQNFGLLSDKEKYEQFKNLVFNNADNTKRKLEEDEAIDCKKSKID